MSMLFQTWFVVVGGGQVHVCATIDIMHIYEGGGLNIILLTIVYI